MIKKLTFLCTILLLTACSTPGVLAPDSNVSWSGERIYFSDGNLLEVIEINGANVGELSYFEAEYVVAPGDKLNVSIWGYPEIFPVMNYSTDNPLNTRTIRTDGTMYFPFIGNFKAEEKTLEQLRKFISDGLSNDFVDPQVDVTVVDFNEGRTVYVVGEFLSPSSVKLGTEPYSLMDAIGEAKGINPQTAEKDVYIMRGLESNPMVYKLTIDTSDKFLLADRFYLSPKDIVFVGPSDLTQWNRVIVQIFPFSSFLNSVDLIRTRN